MKISDYIKAVCLSADTGCVKSDENFIFSRQIKRSSGENSEKLAPKVGRRLNDLVWKHRNKEKTVE